MRQAGILAAAALIGLRDRDRLVEDHARAGDLRAGLSEMFSEAIGGGTHRDVGDAAVDQALAAASGLSGK